MPGFGVIKEIRKVKLEAGTNDLRFTDVAQFIDPTTVSFVDLTKPEGTAVLEQNFEFDLVSPEKLMEKYLDRQISVVVPRGKDVETVTGKLLSSTQGQLVLQTETGVQIVTGQAKLGDLPGGLITRPTLVWKVSAAEGRRASDSHHLPDQRHHLAIGLQPDPQPSRHQG